MKVKSNRRGRWNVMDALILLCVAFVIMVLGYIMFFADGSMLDNVGAKAETQTAQVQYTLEVVSVDDDFLIETDEGMKFLPIEVGEEVYHITKQISLGKVVEQTFNNGVIYLKVKAQSTSGKDGNRIIYKGEQVSFQTPYFTGVCKCIEIGEVTDGE